jgi:dipeptidyl aminopeptidase/acylaminoacyl peptidase
VDRAARPDTPLSEEQARFSPDGRSLAYVIDRDTPFRFNVEVLDLATRAARPLTREAVSVVEPRWSPDGRVIAALRTPDDQQGDALLIEVASGAVRAIPAPLRRGMLRPVGFLADGRALALTTNAGGFMQLATIELGAGRVELVGPSDWDVEAAEVVGPHVVLARNVHGGSEVCVLDAARLADGACRVIASEGVVAALAADRAGRTVTALRRTSTRSAEVVALDLTGGPATTLVPADLGRVDPSELAVAERREIASFDGRILDVYVWIPRVARLGSPGPCVVLAHGGPDSQMRPELVPEAQALAEAGMVVVSPNYRGSSGYGQAFMDLDNMDWGGGDLKDLLAVVDALAARGEIDPARVGILGESFGGYLVLRAATHTPERWAAAVDLYGMPDLVQDYELTKDRFGPWYETEMGTPERSPELFRDRSPLHALDRMRAPLLVLQGENDTNVPRAESDLVVEALRRRGHPVEYVVYPNDGHGFTKRETRVDAMSRTVAFLARHLAARAAGP